MTIKFSFYSVLILLATTHCAAPPLNYYTLSLSDNNLTSQTVSYTDNYPILYVSPVTLPDYLNTSDIIIRKHSLIISSYTGRLSSILSNEITNFIKNNLTKAYPNALVTDQNPFAKPTYQLVVNINLFDIQKTKDKQGILTCEALWYIVPSDKNIKIKKYQTRLIDHGQLDSDENIIALEQKVLSQLTQKITQTLQPMF
ncbi:hypothetical protein COMNV_00112 [Commensalibacter sp. Nvir]|uniref:PqiC family protein n=1 Tax=Commensalibacter sp. Nvir TaxID=3069817 RepID=UPI002D53EC31|nr:hypothetical protein COMNV_00112 [Commensalibacter sp. Nvir]